MKLYHDHALHQCAKWIKSGRKIMKSISVIKRRNSESLNVMRSRKKVKGVYTQCSTGMVATNSRTQDKKFVTLNIHDVIKNKL